MVNYFSWLLIYRKISKSQKKNASNLKAFFNINPIFALELIIQENHDVINYIEKFNESGDETKLANDIIKLVKSSINPEAANQEVKTDDNSSNALKSVFLINLIFK